MKSVQLINLLSILFALILAVSCRTLDNGDHKDWVTIDIRVSQPTRSAGGILSVASSAQTALIIAVPASGSAITTETDLSTFYAQGLQNISTGIVTLSVPLNESMQLVKKTFSSVLELSAASSSSDYTGFGASASFVLTGDVTSKEVAVAVESVGGWTFVDGDGATGINKDITRSAITPHLAFYNTTLNGGFQPTLIAAWSEESASNSEANGYGQIRVAAWNNDSSWSFVDGDGQDGLNEDVTKQAEHTFLFPFDDKLFLAFSEFYDASKRQIQVMTWDGFTWECQGGCDAAPDIVKNNAEDAWEPVMVAFNSTLFIAWVEKYSGYGQIRIKKFDGGASWSWAEPGDPIGINKEWARNADNVQLVVFNSKLYAVWQEEVTLGGARQIRIAEWDGSTGWTFKDGDGATGLNYDVSICATDPVPIVFNSRLYMVWSEKNPSNDIEQIRVIEWDGTTWQFIDGNGVNGLNRNPATGGLTPTIFEHDSLLHVAWAERNTDDIFQLRMIQWDSSSTWTFVDGDDDSTGLNKQSAHDALFPRSVSLESSTFISFMEGRQLIGGDSSNPDQIRVMRR